MSGIAGIYRPSSSIETALLDSMLESMAHRGPDARASWTGGKIALGANLLKTTPESETETPITACSQGRFRLVWDGRIDNREELLANLPEFSSLPDSELFLESYKTWGKDCLQKIVGEFAFALWDSKEETLFAARDRVGAKPFNYVWDGENFSFSSEIKPLLNLLPGAPGFEDEMILSFLSFRAFKEEDHARTFFQKVSRLAPAHCLIIQNGKLEITRYFSWDLQTQLEFETPEDYVRQFKKVFELAVKSRLRSRGNIAMMLSGGHDSSAIAMTASSLLQGKETKLEAVNIYSDDPQADERSYARIIAETAGVSLHMLFGKTRNFTAGLGSFLRQVEAPMINVSRNLEPYQFLQNRGINVALDGEGGDQIVDELGFGADLLARLRIPEFITKSRSFCAEFGDNPKDFLRESLSMIIPEKLQNLRREILGNVPARWLNKKSAAVKKFKARTLRSDTKPRFKSYSQAATYNEITRPYAVMKLELDERAYALHGIELRSPFFDSRLIQFMLSLPWKQRSSGVRKLILKEAMKGVVPEPVRSRRDKAGCTMETDLALRALLSKETTERLCNASGLMKRYVNFSQAQKLAEEYLAGRKDLRFELWFLITTGFMLKQFTQGVSDERKEELKKEVQSAASY